MVFVLAEGVNRKLDTERNDDVRLGRATLALMLGLKLAKQGALTINI